MDTDPTPRRSARPVLAGAAAGAAALLLAAGPAAADTSTAAANAARVGALTAPLATSGTATASNDGSTALVTTAQTPALSVLGGQGGITAGTLVQTAAARGDGTSTACAGLVGSGGAVTVGATGICTTSSGTGGVRVVLVPGTEVRADALHASCTASSDGTATASARLVNARVVTVGLTGNVTSTVLSLTGNPAANSGVTVPGVATLGLNVQDAPAGAGSVRASALRITLLSGLAAEVNVGTVTCGANARTVPVPALPGPAVPVAAAALLVAGWGLRGRVREAVAAVRRG
ncbi:hypothetical protein [Kineococcus terrestris]|uniref:hypothetical protein n=1 Tax=Kineococcus terrestris TaxID=2044856 RepID=UPI0034DAD59A